MNRDPTSSGCIRTNERSRVSIYVKAHLEKARGICHRDWLALNVIDATLNAGQEIPEALKHRGRRCRTVRCAWSLGAPLPTHAHRARRRAGLFERSSVLHTPDGDVRHALARLQSIPVERR